MYQGLNKAEPNFPRKPSSSINSNAFPSNLEANGREFRTVIQMVEYKIAQQFASFGPATITNPAGSITLPVPRKINEAQTLSWGTINGTEKAMGLLGQAGKAVLSRRRLDDARDVGRAAGTIAGAVGVGAGIAVNPFLFMQFQQPNYKEHTLSWSLAASNEKESNILKNIIIQLKRDSLPELIAGGFFMDYPRIAMIRILPDDVFGCLKFKPCAIVSVQVDYSGSGQPSFFRNNAPTVVNLSLQLKEIQLWDRNDYITGTPVAGERLRNLAQGAGDIARAPFD
jgi:hypothetical protein